MSLIVTTTDGPTEALEARARAVAERCGVAFVPRRGSLRRLLARREVAVALVVGRTLDRLHDGRETIAVYEGLTRARLAAGIEHPLLRAVAPAGPGSVRAVFDATLGLAQDALHIAGGLDVDVDGTEASPVVYALLEEGLARLARSPRAEVAHAARRVTARAGSCQAALASLPDDAYDVVYFSPMFAAPRTAPPGYALFREVAVHAPIASGTFTEALRVAPRVVVKLMTDEPVPDALRPFAPACVAGKAVAYWVVTRA